MPDCGKCSTPLREAVLKKKGDARFYLHYYCVKCSLVFCAEDDGHKKDDAFTKAELVPVELIPQEFKRA